MAVNYHDVVAQLQAAGLIIDSLRVGHNPRGNPWRTKVEGMSGRPGWYVVHELQLSGGDLVLVGSFGVYQGNDPNTQKIELQKIELTAEQKAAYRARMDEDRKRAAAARQGEISWAAKKASEKWQQCLAAGEHDYLTRKGVTAHGIRFAGPDFSIEYEAEDGKQRAVPLPGALVIPMQDLGGRTYGLQLILSRSAHNDRIERLGRDKEYWPAGLDKVGKLHLIGAVDWIVLVAEGYATAASLHQATSLPVAVAFDAGNLGPVAKALAKRYPKARILICGDDDTFGKCSACKAPINKDNGSECPTCGEPHRATNAGRDAAGAAALAVGGAAVLPLFADPDKRWAQYLDHSQKLSDFNDLHALEGLAAVRAQVEDRLRALGWASPTAPTRAAGHITGGGGAAAPEDEPLRPIETTDELVERFSLVYGQRGTVFDHQEHTLVALSDMRDACINRDIHRRWVESPQRRIVRVENVGFDPAGEDRTITCNLWHRWPTKPKEGSCELLLELLHYMCLGDPDADALYRWVINWIAYPIQHPGAKMKSTLVIHGPQGTGKNLFFECVMAIYGRYGRVIDQSAIEDKFNDWASRKLFLIADEIVARAELYHIKNKLKSFITGDWIRINPKNMAAYEERNHVNLVFLSNERMPVVLEDDDRRHAVIWTPQKLSENFYNDVAAEIRAGGIPALHHHLLNIDLTGFNEHSKPPMTQAKAELTALSMDSTSRFWRELGEGDVPGCRQLPGLSADYYTLYRAWCARVGIPKPAPLNRLIDALAKREGATTARKRYLRGQGILGPHGVVIPSGHRAPEGSAETAWLGDNIEAFANAVNDYKGANYG